MAAPNVIEVKKLSRIFRNGDIEVHALKDVDLVIGPGEFVAIMGASGSGKSTLLSILGCLDKPTTGEYFLDGVHVTGLDKNELADVRNQKIGFIFQSYNLLPRTTALENVGLPLVYNRSSLFGNPREIATKALQQVGLGDRLHHKPNQMSGGQQQRVAIARALVNDPAIILADEATGNLDSKASIEIAELFVRLNDAGKTIIMITHEPDIAQYAKRIVTFRDGIIAADQTVAQRTPVHLPTSNKTI
ncbi:ABC transporter ATP-binding protein [Parachryseolinea silvisoli]|uniref:ABC transporter ATP-binding protein n=1 Tax=Parachryseolinea silvisoli TaxID=2873601 RepID=UPI002265BAD7|nr:ABC transporter ATP-binding protein [Parachryseolinea silvisoli]MCD9015142.1 ABC transporter ATP-binding protein [Parachryseolinea silvisoli]